MEQTFTLELTVNEGNALLTALSHFPYKDAAPLIQKIQAFAASQLQTPIEVAEETQEAVNETESDNNE